ncbi:hypothetical protein ABPG72_020838, partial [Tetrahymena utriculariae]
DQSNSKIISRYEFFNELIRHQECLDNYKILEQNSTDCSIEHTRNFDNSFIEEYSSKDDYEKQLQINKSILQQHKNNSTELNKYNKELQNEENVQKKLIKLILQFYNYLKKNKLDQILIKQVKEEK